MKYETIDARQIDDLMERKAEIREPAGWSDNSASKPEDSDKPQAKQEVKEEATETAKDAEQPSSSETTSNEAPEKKDSE
jgi:cell division protease FtsH